MNLHRRAYLEPKSKKSEFQRVRKRPMTLINQRIRSASYNFILKYHENERIKEEIAEFLRTICIIDDIDR